MATPKRYHERSRATRELICGATRQTLKSKTRKAPSGASGGHARAPQQKETSWTLEKRRRWWLADVPQEPFPPHPRDKVPEKDLLQAKVQAIEAMQEFGVLVEASRASGMGRSQICYWVRKESTDPDFQLAMRQARRECQERLEGAFIARGRQRGGDLAGIFYLKHNRERYREIQRVELTGKDGSPLQALDAAKAELLLRLGKLAGSAGSGASAGSEGRAGLEGREEIVLSGDADNSRPRLVKAGKKSRAS